MFGGIILGLERLFLKTKVIEDNTFFNKLGGNPAYKCRGWYQSNINYRNPLFAKFQLQKGGYEKSLKFCIARF